MNAALAFSPSDIRSSDVQALAILASTLPDWRVTVPSPPTTVNFNHRDGEGVFFHLPASDGLRASVFRSRTKHICRHVEQRYHPDNARALAEGIADAAGLKKSPRYQFIKDVVNELGDASLPAPAPPPEPEPEPEVVKVVKEVTAIVPNKPERRIVSETPARARRTMSGNDVLTYESPTAMERTWSDGTTDYACRYSGCDYTAAKFRSVAAHFRAHGEAAGSPPTDGVIPDAAPDYRVRRLAGLIRKAIREGIDPNDADAMATFLVDNRPSSSGDSDDTDPVELTPEQVLDRIARLVDRGETARLNTRLDELQASLDEMTARAERSEGALGALRDMLVSEAPES